MLVLDLMLGTQTLVRHHETGVWMYNVIVQFFPSLLRSGSNNCMELLGCREEVPSPGRGVLQSCLDVPTAWLEASAASSDSALGSAPLGLLFDGNLAAAVANYVLEQRDLRCCRYGEVFLPRLG